MKQIIVAAAVLAFTSMAALADAKPSDADAAKLKGIADAWGFTGGTYEHETEGSGVYEIDDAVGKDGGHYDIKVSKDWKVLSITAD